MTETESMQSTLQLYSNCAAPPTVKSLWDSGLLGKPRLNTLPSSRPERLHWPLALKRKLWGSGTWYKGAKVAVRVKSRVCLFLIGGQGKVWAAPYCCTWNSRQGRVATLRFMWSRLSMPRDSMRRWATLLSMYRTHMCVVTRLFSAFQWTNIYSDITNMHIILRNNTQEFIKWYNEYTEFWKIIHDIVVFWAAETQWLKFLWKMSISTL